jgi:hypothetical protein
LRLKLKLNKKKEKKIREKATYFEESAEVMFHEIRVKYTRGVENTLLNELMETLNSKQVKDNRRGLIYKKRVIRNSRIKRLNIAINRTKA